MQKTEYRNIRLTRRSETGHYATRSKVGRSIFKRIGLAIKAGGYAKFNSHYEDETYKDRHGQTRHLKHEIADITIYTPKRSKK